MLKGVLSTLDSIYAVENRSCLHTIKYKVNSARDQVKRTMSAKTRKLTTKAIESATLYSNSKRTCIFYAR